MGKTADLAMVQKPGSLLKGVAVQGVLYQSILNLKLTGRKKLGRKRCTSNRDGRKLENTVKQCGFKHIWESFTRSELKLEWVHQESPRSDIFRKRATKPLLKRKQCQKHLTWAKEKNNWTVAQWSKVLFSDKSTFCISLEIKVWRKIGEAQNPSCLKSSVKFPKSVMIWGAMTSAGVCPLYQVQSQCSCLPRDFGALYAFICWQALWRCNFQMVCWPWYYCIWLASQHAWLKPHMESMGYFQEKDEKQSIQQ